MFFWHQFASPELVCSACSPWGLPQSVWHSLYSCSPGKPPFPPRTAPARMIKSQNQSFFYLEVFHGIFLAVFLSIAIGQSRPYHCNSNNPLEPHHSSLNHCRPGPGPWLDPLPSVLPHLPLGKLKRGGWTWRQNQWRGRWASADWQLRTVTPLTLLCRTGNEPRHNNWQTSQTARPSHRDPADGHTHRPRVSPAYGWAVLAARGPAQEVFQMPTAHTPHVEERHTYNIQQTFNFNIDLPWLTFNTLYSSKCKRLISTGVESSMCTLDAIAS